jgi:hypothetical protein
VSDDRSWLDDLPYLLETGIDDSRVPRYERLSEGSCPICDAVLERRPDRGNCAPCTFGWSLNGTVVTLYGDTVDIDIEVTFGAGRVVHSRVIDVRMPGE